MLAIGLMSGTSLDGVDAALIETDGDKHFLQLEKAHIPYPNHFQSSLRQLIDTRCNWFELERQLTIYHAEAVNILLNKESIHYKDVSVIGFHGQTIYHNPKEGISWQIGNPHLLAKLTNIDVVSDFRRRDIANSGQGAPLVPVFHRCLMQSVEKPVAILNIGGISNITYLNDNNQLIAFDTGMGNAMINDAMLKYYNKLYDKDGLVAKSGKVDNAIIEQLLKDEFFAILPPKSLDRNYFNKYLSLFESLDREDIIATLTAFTVFSIHLAQQFLSKTPNKIYICGGGVNNLTMMQELRTLIHAQIFDIADIGYDADFIEAQAFGYLAVRYLRKLPSSFQTTTSANRETISGVLFQI